MRRFGLLSLMKGEQRWVETNLAWPKESTPQKKGSDEGGKEGEEEGGGGGHNPSSTACLLHQE